MDADRQAFLNMLEKPGLLTPVEVDYLTGLDADVELPIAAKVSILKPVGHPLPPKARRLYMLTIVRSFLSNETEVRKVRVAMLRHWQKKNRSRRNGTRKNQ
jgi:hypothetical protein